MGRAIERIEQDIAALQEAIQAIASELHSAYASYLGVLGQALGKQLILASYHLCTQGYPENFLKLSLNQRQQLQQGIRKLGKQAAERLLIQLMSPEIEGDGEDEEDEEDAEVGEEEALTSAAEVSQVYVLDTSNPVVLAKWQQYIEEETQRTLRKVSHETNVLLQKAQVLPQKLPEPILEAAAAASEASAEMMPGPPNLLNLVIEIENEQDEEESSLTQITTVNLRLGEIEFADPTLSSSRKQIRHVLGKLNQLGREYQKKQRERSIAEAEAAWRSSWYED
ncbi:conserved hypothetical protein [Trichormus variabilis ATCC 29413]|uniref:Uncharacterized protein n=2 Tax=Anabaena variabilis TaxID=264691 RepID=Q3MBF5_TRIV2|nr:MULTISPECIES: hypothetical protein [Nostocaceae]ABA21681.1 conserved hypothetical protein [Trichormus variabilis ATCC 29413]MBC1213030.1 hypothetical protein [Trichormus variabilis ARAD]MBC1256491.1 hypothetical protein [Trichormus variabilis V5]MBC1270100.1 hypothetical protein [Trichormus variabilis FSR]MBC1303690.1 hypothetical protein [Trichormus variabilis N2B]